MKFHGRVIGDEEVLDMIKRAPAVYMRYMREYLKYAGKVFIGTKKTVREAHTTRRGIKTSHNATMFKNGIMRNTLGSIQSTRGGTWQRNFVNTAANYEIDNNAMRMRAGVIYNNKKLVHTIIEDLESGYTRNSSGRMLIPNYKNLTSSALSGVYKASGIFGKLMDANRLKPIFKHGNIYYIDKKDGKLLFTSTKQIRIKPQFNFDTLWLAAQPQIRAKADTVLDRATVAVEKKEAKVAKIG